MRWLLTIGLLGLATCGGRPTKAEGEACFASSECDTGLVCDFAAEPAVCKSMGSGPGPQPDGPVGPVIDGTPGDIDADQRIFDAAPLDAPL